MESKELTGKIKFYNGVKGYGFITDDKSEEDVFFHVSGLLDRVESEDLVSFEIEEGERGPKAVNVKKQPVEVKEEKENVK